MIHCTKEIEDRELGRCNPYFARTSKIDRASGESKVLSIWNRAIDLAKPIGTADSNPYLNYHLGEAATPDDGLSDSDIAVAAAMRNVDELRKGQASVRRIQSFI